VLRQFGGNQVMGVQNKQTFFKKRFDPKGASFRFASYRFHKKTVKQNTNQYAYNVGSGSSFLINQETFGSSLFKRLV